MPKTIYLEIELEEEMVKTIPSAEIVRYFLSGSEATSAAIKKLEVMQVDQKLLNGDITDGIIGA